MIQWCTEKQEASYIEDVAASFIGSELVYKKQSK
jgi:hypothetical protein